MLDEVKKYKLHCELILPEPGDPNYLDQDKITTFTPFNPKRPGASAAFLGSQRAVENFKPWVTNADKPAILQIQLGLNAEAHRAAFLASQMAVNGFNTDASVKA